MSSSQATNPPQILAELHTHSTASDGELAPAALAQRVAEVGAKVWSLTDHDTCRGCLEAAEAASALGVQFIPGVEISAYLNGRSIHVLGYGVDPLDEGFESFLNLRRRQREDRMGLMIERAQALGLKVTPQDVEAIAAGASLTRPHLARALVANGQAASIQEAFDRWLAEGKPAYVENSPLTVPEAIACIKRAGGVAILAHPGIYDADEHIAGWVHQAGLDGVEVAHPSHSEERAAAYLKMTSWLGVLATRSSDFHGESVRPDRQLGRCLLDQAVLDELVALIATRRA